MGVYWRPAIIDGFKEADLWNEKYKSSIRDWEIKENRILLPKSLDTAYVKALR